MKTFGTSLQLHGIASFVSHIIAFCGWQSWSETCKYSWSYKKYFNSHYLYRSCWSFVQDYIYFSAI